MKRESSKWLLRKVSGSRGKYTYKPDYSDSRNKKINDLTSLPYRQPIGKGSSNLDTTLVKRWLYSQIGKNFDQIYSDFIRRIQPKYRHEYSECIYWYVIKPENIEYENDAIQIKSFSKTFYINPKTNILERFSDLSIKESKPIFIVSRNSTFRYYSLDKNWKGEVKSICIIINDPLKKLKKEDLPEIDKILNNLTKHLEKSKDEIKSFAKNIKNEELLFSKFYMLSLTFNVEQGLDKFKISIEVGSQENYTWITEFHKDELVNFYRIKK